MRALGIIVLALWGIVCLTTLDRKEPQPVSGVLALATLIATSTLAIWATVVG